MAKAENNPKPEKRAKKCAKLVDVTEGLSPMNLNAAGIDVGSAEHYVAVPIGRDPHPVQKFGSFTADLYRLVKWLLDCGVKSVVMQATGVYWIGLYQILEEHGLEVMVTIARARPQGRVEGPNRCSSHHDRSRHLHHRTCEAEEPFSEQAM